MLAFDADAAGQAAADRVYEWERRFDLDVSVAAMPKGSDPADLARTDPDVLREAIANAVPLLGFRVARVLEAGRLTTPEGRTRAAEAALEVIREHPNELVRDQYVMQVAARCQQDPDRLRARARTRVADRHRDDPHRAGHPAHARDRRGSRAEAARCIDGTRPRRICRRCCSPTA